MLKIASPFLGLLLVLLWQGTSTAEAIETGSLQGAVRDENGKPVTGAAVKIRNVERGITVTVFSRSGNCMEHATIRALYKRVEGAIGG